MGTIVVILILLLAIVSLVCLRYGSYRAPLPPGPPGYPIIGNLFDAPTRMPWVKYRQWSDIYGKGSPLFYKTRQLTVPRGYYTV